jgi:pSer/pThr/pTyr-binding forkhead associated (FHA) protein
VPELSLEIVEGAGAGRMVVLGGPVTVGRGRDADLVLADELVSRHHARVTPSGPAAVVEDLGSRNGTFVNGEGIHGPARLTPGDQLQLGVTLVELRSATQIAERPSAVHPVPPPLAVAPRTPDYLAGTDPDPQREAGAAARSPAEDRAVSKADDGSGAQVTGGADAQAVGGASPLDAGTSGPAGAGPGGRPRHELEPLLDSRTKGKARTAPLALFVLVALVVIIYLATAR